MNPEGEDISKRAESAEAPQPTKQFPPVKSNRPNKEDAWGERHGASWRYLGNGAYMRAKFSN